MTNPMTPNDQGKVIKCDLFLIVGYPHESECQATIKVSGDFKEAMKQMAEFGWRKCGSGTKTPGHGFGYWGYFCPKHANNNQFYQGKVEVEEPEVLERLELDMRMMCERKLKPEDMARRMYNAGYRKHDSRGEINWPDEVRVSKVPGINEEYWVGRINKMLDSCKSAASSAPKLIPLDIQWPEENNLPVKYPDTREFRNGFSFGQDDMLAKCKSAVAKAGIVAVPSVEKLYTLMMKEFSEARNAGHTNLYIHGDAVYYVAEQVHAMLTKSGTKGDT